MPEQTTPTMMSMMTLLVEKVSGLQETVDQVSAHTGALEGALADVSLSGSGEPPTGSGSVSVVPMGATSAERLERAPDQGPSRDGALHSQDNDDDVAMVSDAWATATADGATAAERNAGAGGGGVAADGTAGSRLMDPSGTVAAVPGYQQASADRFRGGEKLRKHLLSPVASVGSGGGGAQAANLDSAAAAAAAAAARAQWWRREQQAQVEADGQSADGTDQARSGDTPNESGSVVVSPSQDGSLPADVPSGSAEEEHSGSEEPLSRELETLGGGPPLQNETRDYELGRIGNALNVDDMGASGVSATLPQRGEMYEPIHGSMASPAPAAVSEDLLSGSCEETAGESLALETPPPLTGRGSLGRSDTLMAVAEEGGLPVGGASKPVFPAGLLAAPPNAVGEPHAVLGDSPFEASVPSDTEGSHTESEVPASSTTSTRTVILPRDSTPGSAPSVGGSQVGPADAAVRGVSSPESAADAGPPSPSGRPTTSVDDGDDDGDEEDEEEFKTVPNLGPLLADQAAARRESVSTQDDFLPPRIRELVGDTEMVVRFDDSGTEVLLTEDRPATTSRPGCRAGWTIQLCGCELAQEDCDNCQFFKKKDNDEVIRIGNADHPVAGDVRDAVDGDASGNAALDDSATTVDLSAVAEALGGPLSPAENSLAEEEAALRRGHVQRESFVVDDSSILQEGGGADGDESEWKADDVVGLSSFSSSNQSTAPPVPISEQLKAALVVAVDLATKLALSHEAPPEEGDLRAKLDFAVGGDQAICERIGELLIDVDGRPDDSVSPDDIDIETWRLYCEAQKGKAQLSELKSEWRQKESGRDELVIFSNAGVEEMPHSGEAVSKAQALLATTLAHCADVQGREAELQRELDALNRRTSTAQKSILDYIDIEKPKGAATEKALADTVRFASELAGETGQLSARVTELKGENENLRNYTDLQVNDLEDAHNMIDNLERSLEEKEEALEESVSKMTPIQHSVKQLQGQLKKVVKEKNDSVKAVQRLEADNKEKDTLMARTLSVHQETNKQHAEDGRKRQKAKLVAAEAKKVAEATLKGEREQSLKKLDASMDEVKALKKENAAVHEKLKSQGEKNQLRNQQLAEKWRAAEDNANVSAEKEKLARLRAEAAESKATEQEERVQALSQEVKETREQISKLGSADRGGGDPPDDSSSDESDGDADDSHRPPRKAGKAAKPLGEDLETVLNVNVYSSGKFGSTLAQPLLLLVQKHAETAAEQDCCPSSMQPLRGATGQISFKGPKYSEVKYNPRSELTARAQEFTLAVVVAAGVEENELGMSLMRNSAQWEIGGVTQLDDGTRVYDVMCCVEPWVMAIFSQQSTFTSTPVFNGEDMDEPDFAAVNPYSAAIILAAHEARRRFWEQTDAWSIVWEDCDHHEYSAFNRKIGQAGACNVALRYGARTEEARQEQGEVRFVQLPSWFEDVAEATAAEAAEAQAAKSFGVSPIKTAASPAKPAATAGAVTAPEPEPEPVEDGVDVRSTEGEVSASASPPVALESAPASPEKASASPGSPEGPGSPKSFDWLVRKLGSGNDHDQAQAFMKMEPAEQMDILMRVDLFNGDMCKKKLSKAEREGPLHGRLLKKWIKRIHATGAWPLIRAKEAEGEKITRLDQIWSVDAPPSRFCNEKDESDPGKKSKQLTAFQDAKLLVVAIKKCADRKSVEFLDAEEKIKAALQAAQDESGGNVTRGLVKASAKLSAMGIEEDTIEDITAIDGVGDGNAEHSFCEATAQVMYAELEKDDGRDDDGESVRSGSSSSSSSHGADRSAPGFASTGSRLSKSVENKLRDVHNSTWGKTDTEKARKVKEVLKTNILVERQGGHWTLTETQDVKALMAKFAQVCRDSGILGITDPDAGVNVLSDAVGECPEHIRELWENLEVAPKYAGERLKIEILLELLADYTTTKEVSGGDYPSVVNPTSLVNEMKDKHVEDNRGNPDAEPLLFEDVREALEGRFRYTNKLYNHLYLLVDTRIDRLDLTQLRLNMVAAIEAAQARDDLVAEVSAEDESFKTESQKLAPILVQYVKGVAVFLEGRLKDMLIVSGHDQDDKYREWSILEEIEKIWIRLVDQHVEKITKSALMSREQISDYKERYMDKKSKQRYHVKWDMVKGLHNLASKSDDEVPITALEMLDWIIEHARTSVTAWISDNVLTQSRLTDTLSLKDWVPVAGHAPNHFARPDTTRTCRLRHLVTARIEVTGTTGKGSRETLHMIPPIPIFDCDPDGKRPHSAGYGTRQTKKEIEEDKQKKAAAKQQATEKRQAREKAAAAKKKQSGGGGGNGVNNVNQPRTGLSPNQRTTNIRILRECVFAVASCDSSSQTLKKNMHRLKEQCIMIVMEPAKAQADKTTVNQHVSWVDEFRQVARSKTCPKLETYLSSLKSPDAAQKKINEKYFSVQSFAADRVEAFRNFGCMGCGTSLHLFLNPNSGKHCEHAHLESQTKYWKSRPKRVTPLVTAETTPPDTRIYKQYKGQSVPYMRKTASQTGQHGRKGGRSVFVSNQSAGRSIGDSAYAIDGVNALASASVDAPEDPALNQQRLEMFNEQGVHIDTATGDSMIIATVTLGVNDECAAALGLPECGKADTVGGVSGGPAAGLQRNADGSIVYTDENGVASTLHKMNAEKDPVFTPPSSPHGSDEEDDGVNLEDESSKAAPAVAAHSPFPEKPPWYRPRRATFKDTKNGIVPTATITCAENGVQATGCLDTGAVMCVMDTAKAQDMDIKPWDGQRTATAANGNSMVVHGVAHGVEVFMDGHRLEVDFLVADLGSRFDFLLGYDFMRHYRAYVVPETGQLRGYDADGNRFISKSNYSYARVLDEIGGDDEDVQASTNAVMEGVRQQLAHELSEERGLELKAEETECLQRFKQASIATHRALRNSENEVIRAKMEGAWKADSGDIAKDQAGELRYYKEVMNCDEINQLDVDVDAARQYMNTTATAFARAETALEEHDSRVAAHKQAEDERNSAVAVQVKEVTRSQKVKWAEHARNIASEFGDFVNTSAAAGFHAARGAVKQTTTFLMQLLL